MRLLALLAFIAGDLEADGRCDADMVAPAAAFAICSCLRPVDPAVSRRFSDAVFVGVVDSVTASVEQPPYAVPGIPARRAWFRVLAAWTTDRSEPRRAEAVDSASPLGLRSLRPALADSVAVVGTGGGGGDCGYGFAAGEIYLVYAFERAGRLYTTICTRTRLVRDAAEDLASLGPPSVDSWGLRERGSPKR
jgi:hypothetical protein